MIIYFWHISAVWQIGYFSFLGDPEGVDLTWIAGLVYWKNGIFPQGAFHLSELTGQTIPVVMRISLLIKTIQQGMLNLK